MEKNAKPSTPETTPTIGFIGAGKVGFTLGKRFESHGIKITGYYSKNHESAAEAASFTNSIAFEAASDLILNSDIVFLTVPDAAIRSCFESLDASTLKGKIICHCSGALTASDAFPQIEQMGAFGYSVHPLFAISDRYHSHEAMDDAFFCIEGSEEGLEDIKSLIERCGNPVQLIQPEAKTLYHAAAAIASNHVIALVSQSLNLLADCGFSEEDALAALRPILIGNMNCVAQVGPCEALTGPVERCDTNTVRKHINALPSQEDKQLYVLLSQKLVEVAKKKHPDRDYRPMNDAIESIWQDGESNSGL